MSKAPKFQIHFNREMGKKYYSAKEYYGDMKRAGLSPYDPSTVKKVEPKPYERSDWAKAMHQDVKDRNGRPPGDRFIKELEKRGYSQKRADEARKLARDMR